MSKIVFMALALIVVIAIVVTKLKTSDEWGLIDGPDQYIGKELVIAPFYGYGWADSAQNSVEVPESFSIELEGLFAIDGTLIGGVGKVTTENHLFSGHWIDFSLRHRRTSSLAVKDAAYNVIISPYPFTMVEGEFPKVLQEGGTRYGGWGYVYHEGPRN